MPLKLLQLNVELHFHWDKIIPFLEKEDPDVICLQECFESDVAMLVERFGYHVAHQPISKRLISGAWERLPGDTSAYDLEGQVLLSRFPLENVRKEDYYSPGPDFIEQPVEKDELVLRKMKRQGVVVATVQKENIPYRIATTHFTWAPPNPKTSHQQEDVEQLLTLLENEKELLLCGDFNIIRGASNIYDQLAEKFIDNIPKKIKGTIDPDLHRMSHHPTEGPLLATYVVDYIFSRGSYDVSDVRLQCGVSDHCAVIAEISKKA